MAGIYIHIPFCKRACHYCNFHFSTSLLLKNDFIGALLSEIELQRNYLGKAEIKTIYFGGGTPSLLSVNELGRIFEKLQAVFNIAAEAEITLEANPDDITAGKLREWKQSGINRFSIGIQSFFDEDLQWMNRAHNAAEAENCIQWVKEAGFENFSVDLIYGGPGLTDAHWQQNMDKVIALRVPHISCYALTVEPKTALEKMIQQHKKEAIDPDKQASHFLLLMERLQQAGYEHYEISNFAQPGYRSKHNSSYWQGEPYLGLGPSAHSFNGNSRQWNIASNALYIQALKKGVVNYEKEILSREQQINEYIMTALRTAEGINFHFMAQHFGEQVKQQVMTSLRQPKYQSKIHFSPDKAVLTQEGKLFADGIAADLFFM